LPPPGGRGCRYAPGAADASIKFTWISRDIVLHENDTLVTPLVAVAP